MDIAPRNKTAILRYIIDKAFPNFWNISSLMRKRIFMVMEEMTLTVKEYNEELLKVSESIKIGKLDKIIENTEDIKKGVSNYTVKTKEQVDTLISLNGELRCHYLWFYPETKLEVAEVASLMVSNNNFDLYSNCFIKRVRKADFINVSTQEISQILSKIERIDQIVFRNCSLSNLNLAPLKIQKAIFSCVAFDGTINFPSHFKCLDISNCEIPVNQMNCKRIEKIYFQHNTNSSEIGILLQKLKGVKKIFIDFSLESLIEDLPSTLRWLDSYIHDLKTTDFEKMKAKLPYLVEINSQIPIEAAQILNLKSVTPKINETEEIFTYRPREIKIYENNHEELRKHPELFEKTERIVIYYDKFNFDYLSEKIKKIVIVNSSFTLTDYERFEENSWKLKDTELTLHCREESIIRWFLNSIKQAKKVVLNRKFKDLIADYTHLKFQLL